MCTSKRSTGNIEAREDGDLYNCIYLSAKKNQLSRSALRNAKDVYMHIIPHFSHFFHALRGYTNLNEPFGNKERWQGK